MEDINLDFLSSPTRPEQQTERIPTPIVINRFSNAVFTRNRRLEIAEKIAKVDELVREIERFKLDNNELKRQLKDFQKTAADVQHMYSEEKHHHETVKKDLQQLKYEYDKIDSDLANKNMVYDQISARLAEYEGRPIEYNSLLVKYVKLMQKLDGEDFLRYSQDKSSMEELKQYCVKMNLRIPSPKKGKCRAVKTKTVNSSVQCSDLGFYPATQKPVMHDQYTQCMNARLKPTNIMKEKPCTSRPELNDQYAPCQVAKRDQASQYISTMITRQTNTDKIVQKHVSTMFPEPKPTPPINDILNVFCKWADIRSITPLEDSPKSRQSNKVSKTSTTTGTCTMLCNIRRKIDYLPAFAPGIKQELPTPSPSPTPNSNSASGAPNRPHTSSGHTNMNQQNHLPNSILTLFNANSNSALGQLSTPAFNELWQIFGTMLLSLLQTSNAGIANISQNSINQQQFLDWLLELYMNSQFSSTTNAQTVTNQVNSTQTSPLRFDESSVLSSANIVRPQVKKSFATGMCSSSENEIALQSQLPGDNNSQIIEQQSAVMNTTPTTLTDEHFSQDSNSIDIEIQNIQAAANIIEAQSNLCITNLNQPIKAKKVSKKSRKSENNQNLLEKIQELLPEAKLNKKKSKALKRLLKKPTKNKIVEIPENKHIETAVDFLKMFALDQGEFQNLSHINRTSVYRENEMSIQNWSMENVENFNSLDQTENLKHCSKPKATSTNDEFTFIKPAVSQTQSHQHKVNFSNSTFIKPAEKPKKSYINKRIENKYQMLFGDSDNELDEEDDKPNRHLNPVISDENIININENSLEQALENCQYSLDVIRDNSYNTEFKHPTTNSLQIFTDNSLNQTTNNIFVDISSQEQFSIPEISTPLLEDLVNVSPFKSPLNPVFNKFEPKTTNEKHSEMQTSVTEFQASETIEDLPVHIHKDLENLDLELSSDQETTIEKNDHQNKHELMPSNNDSYKFEIYSQKHNALPELQENRWKYKTKTNQKKTQNYNNVKFSYNNDTSSLPSILNSCSQQDMDLENNHTKHKENIDEKTFKRRSSSECFSVTKTYASDFEKDFELSSDNESVLTEIENQSKDELKPNYKIESISSVDALSESEENSSSTTSQPIEQDFYGFDNDLQVNDKIKQQDLKEEQNNLSEIAETSHSNNNYPTSDESSSQLCNLKPLPDFKETFSQEGFNSNSTINNEQNLPNSKLSTVNKKEKLENTTNSTLPNQTAIDNGSPLTTCDDEEEISIIEISSDVTGGVDYERELENDLIIDEDYYDKTNHAPDNVDQTTIHNYALTKTEDHNYSKFKLNDDCKTEHLRDSSNSENTLDSSTISNLLNSTLYNEVLTDSISPIVCDLLKEDVILKTPPQVIKSKRGRKRKSECLAEVERLQPCKRSQRLKAKQMVLEQSLDISECSIEIEKYTRNRRNSNKDFKPINGEESKKKSDTKIVTKIELDTITNLPQMDMGFFLERKGQEEHQQEEESIIMAKKESVCNNKLEQEEQKSINVKQIIENNDDDKITCLPNSIESPAETKATDHLNDDKTATLNEAFYSYSESPKSPPPLNSNDDHLNRTYNIEIPLERPLQYLPQHKNATLFDTLINSYSIESHKSIQAIPSTKVNSRQQQLLHQLQKDIEMYGNSEMELDPHHTANNLVNKLLKKSEDYDLIQKALLNVAQMAESLTVPELELPSVIQELPPRHLGCCLQRLFVVLRHFLNRNMNFCQELLLKIEKLLFVTQRGDTLSLQATLNLTQLYLSACKQQEYIVPAYKHPGRLFIAKCLYYYDKKAVLMIHEVLLWYPTVLPHREDTTYDRSDALITVIQQVLMNTRYDMGNQDLRGKSLISKLRYEYHFEVFSPSLDEVIVNLVDKLKNEKFYNISLAFGLQCKRLKPLKVQEQFLNAHLLPLANEYYNKALITTEFDKRISVLLEIISMIVKPFPVETNVEVYLNEFSRFLNGFDRPIIQEAALCSIIRLQRFGFVNCFNFLHHFKANFELDTHTQAKLKTFLYRKPLMFWKTIRSQNPRN